MLLKKLSLLLLFWITASLQAQVKGLKIQV